MEFVWCDVLGFSCKFSKRGFRFSLFVSIQSLAYSLLRSIITDKRLSAHWCCLSMVAAVTKGHSWVLRHAHAHHPKVEWIGCKISMLSLFFLFLNIWFHLAHFRCVSSVGVVCNASRHVLLTSVPHPLSIERAAVHSTKSTSTEWYNK
jgi:hypothetical protein